MGRSVASKLWVHKPDTFFGGAAKENTEFTPWDATSPGDHVCTIVHVHVVKATNGSAMIRQLQVLIVPQLQQRFGKSWRLVWIYQFNKFFGKTDNLILSFCIAYWDWVQWNYLYFIACVDIPKIVFCGMWVMNKGQEVQWSQGLVKLYNESRT